jgi:hypothetical protein
VGIPETGDERNRGSVAGVVRKGEGIFTRGIMNDKGTENIK